jgi:hypothetical protein
MKLKKCLTVALSAIMATAALTGCSSSSDKSSGTSSDDKGSVYYLSFKPEQEDQWKKSCKNL